MRRSPVLLLVGATSVSIAIGLGVFSWRSAQAEEAASTAHALLAPSFARAPELDDIAAADALIAIERAEELGLELETARHYAQALIHLKQGDLIFAEGSLTAARHARGWTVELQVLAAAIERAQLHIEQAEDHVAEALALDPEHPRALLLHADLALDRRDGRGALLALGRLVEEVATSDAQDSMAALQNRRGLALELNGEARSSEEAYRRALQADATLHSAWINIGRVLRNRGAIDEAANAFDKAIEQQVGDADAWLGRALCALDRDDFDRAAEAFARARELAPHEITGLVGSADVALRRGDMQAALEGYRAALREAPRDASLWVKLGNAMVRGRELRGAEQAFRDAIARSLPNDRATLAAAHNGLGATLLQRGALEDAAVELRRAAELDPDDPNPLMNLALVHERHGDSQSARDAWREALERAPDSEVAQAHLRGS